MQKTISVIGAGRLEGEQGRILGQQAEELGERIARAGLTLVCGGLGGVMEAACRGAKSVGGKTVGLVPGSDRGQANEFVDCPVATGLGQMRNFLVVINGDVVVACGGGYGTLSEIGLARKSGKTVIAMGSWNDLPGVIGVNGPVEAIETAIRFLEQQEDG